MGPGKHLLHPSLTSAHGEPQQLQPVQAAHQKPGLGPAQMPLQENSSFHRCERFVPEHPQSPRESLHARAAEQL
ncbi:hypothetical protein ACJ65_11730 [Kocuria rhizophila]|nr:hypothetical protein ACJ65_11730 [Kocuria rhizophila]